MTKTYYTSRTPAEDYQACPRLRFLGYELGRGRQMMSCTNSSCGVAYPVEADSDPSLRHRSHQGECAICGSPMEGITHVGGMAPKGISIYLLVGSAIHAGLAILLGAAKSAESSKSSAAGKLDGAVMDHAVEIALAAFDAVESPNLHSTPSEHRDWKLAEQRAMVEGLVRAFALAILPGFVERYEILEVEQEYAFPLARVETITHDDKIPQPVEIIFEGRVDALLRERDTDDIHICSFKTAKEWSKLAQLQFRHDTQGLSETMAYEESQRQLRQAVKPVSMIQMLILLKGKEYEEKPFGAGSGNGKWIHYSPLTRGFRLEVDGVVPDQTITQWAWSYDTQKTYERGPKRGEQYLGCLGREWKAVSVWDNYPGGMKAWVEDLYRGKWQPEMGDPFSKVFVMPEPWPRSDAELADLRDQLTYQETKIVHDSVAMNAVLDEIYIALQCGLAPVNAFNILRDWLNRLFPQTRKSCVRYGGMCWAEGICFGSAGAWSLVHIEELVSPASRSTLRRPHHALEMGLAGLDGGE